MVTLFPIRMNVGSFKNSAMKKLDLIEDRWLSIKELAEYLGVRRETIYVYLEKKNLPGHRIGKFWKFKIAEVDVWVHSGEAGETKQWQERALSPLLP